MDPVSLIAGMLVGWMGASIVSSARSSKPKIDDTICPKCDWGKTAFQDVSWEYRRPQFGDDYIKLKCGRCGYEWFVACADRLS